MGIGKIIKFLTYFIPHIFLRPSLSTIWGRPPPHLSNIFIRLCLQPLLYSPDIFMSFSILSIHLLFSIHLPLFHSTLIPIVTHTAFESPVFIIIRPKHLNLSHFINNWCHSYIIPNELISYSVLPRHLIHPSYILTILISHLWYKSPSVPNFFFCPLPQHSDSCNIVIMWLASKLLYRIYLLISTVSVWTT